jgi:hypothetical protein
MTQQHPVPPPELVQQWAQLPDDWNTVAFHIAQWGADQELEACCEWLDREGWSGESRQLRAARRPKPSSLKEQALKVLSETELRHEWTMADEDIIRRALEQLND